MSVVLDQLSPTRAKRWLNKKDQDFYIPLHYAVRYNYLEMTQLLIEKGSSKS